MAIARYKLYNFYSWKNELADRFWRSEQGNQLTYKVEN